MNLAREPAVFSAVNCPTDDEAIAIAGAACREHPAVEVWGQARRVERVADGIETPSDQSLKPLWRTASKHLGLDPSAMEDEDIKKVLSGLNSVVDGIGSHRTHAGSALVAVAVFTVFRRATPVSQFTHHIHWSAFSLRPGTNEIKGRRHQRNRSRSLPGDFFPPLLRAPTPKAARRVMELFSAQINNDHARKPYLNATRRRAEWCEAHTPPPPAANWCPRATVFARQHRSVPACERYQGCPLVKAAERHDARQHHPTISTLQYKDEHQANSAATSVALGNSHAPSPACKDWS